MKANKVSNNDVRKFTEELSKSLEIDNLLIYNCQQTMENSQMKIQ